MPGSSASRRIESSGSCVPPSRQSAPGRVRPGQRDDAARRGRRGCRAARSRPRSRPRPAAAAGVSRFNSGNGVAIDSPKASTKRPAMVVAAFTVTCWPRIARRPISKPSKAPGTRTSRVGLHRRRQPRILAEVPGDHIRPRIEIEERPHAAQQRRQHRRERVGELHQQRVFLLAPGHADPALPPARAARSGHTTSSSDMLDAHERARPRGTPACRPSRTAGDTTAAASRCRPPAPRPTPSSPGPGAASAASGSAR